MEIQRTASAGVLLRLDNVTILLDGVCREVKPYPATPPVLRSFLLQELPDVVAFTHTHADHYDESFISDYLQKAAGPVLGPADIPICSKKPYQKGQISITPIESHHMGKVEPIDHRSYVITGSKCVWFMGDATPLHWLERNDLPRPDVLIAPYGFAIGHGWEITKALNPGILVLLHLPEREDDPYGLWDAVEQTVKNQSHPAVIIPRIGENICLI